MTRYLPIGALLVAGLLAASQAVSAPRSAETDAQKIVILGDAGPVVVELRMRIDGESFRAKHQALISSIFADLDRNGDGVLSRAEADRAPPTSAMTSPIVLLGRRGPVQMIKVAGGEEKVTREMLATHYSKTGLPAFQMIDPTAPPLLGRGGPVSNEPPGEVLTDRLFALLDTDKDGKLSRKELEAAPAILGALDIDEDELVTPSELMGEPSGTTGYGAAVFQFARMRTAGPRMVFAISEGSENEALAKALGSRYAKRGDGVSVAKVASKTPDVVLAINLGKRGEQPAISLLSGKLPASVQVKATTEGARLQLGTTRLNLRTAEPAPLPIRGNLNAQYKTLFQRTDADGNGFLDRMEATRSGIFAPFFAAMDADGDGKVTEKEMLAYVESLDSLRKVAERSCASLNVTAEGKGLFSLLDTNGDGKLSVRELRNAHQLLGKFATEDGKLARTSVPRQLSMTLAVGPNGGSDALAQRLIASRVRDVRGGERREVARGPMWFQKMDRNRDGDVSRKEFVGTEEQFKEIDADGDGLISADEAERYDRLKRGGRE